MFTRFIHVVAHISTSFLLTAEYISLYGYTTSYFSNQHLGCLHLLAIVNTIVNIHIQVFVWKYALNSLEIMLTCETTELYNAICNL